MDKKIKKFESQGRIGLLKPEETLKRAGLTEKSVVCDLGAGTGLFTFEAAKVSSQMVYALDVSEAMLKLLKERVVERNLENVIVKKVDNDRLPLGDEAIDLTILVTVLHEVPDYKITLMEINRILKKGGRLLLIDFHKKETKMGPPLSERLSEDFVEGLCKESGFSLLERTNMEDVLYCHIYEK